METYSIIMRAGVIRPIVMVTKGHKRVNKGGHDRCVLMITASIWNWYTLQ